MSEIGRWVLEKACQDRRRWRRAGGRETTISVNLSARQLMSPGLAETVAAVLHDTETEARHVALEFPEGIFLVDPERAHVVLDQLRRLGVTLTLDDFGSGHSSLGYLQRFPIDVVKIDAGLVAGPTKSPANAVIVSAVVELAGVLGMKVIADRVETSEQHRAVEALGCDSCQGFYFARPRSAEGVGALLWESDDRPRPQSPAPVGGPVGAPSGGRPRDA